MCSHVDGPSTDGERSGVHRVSLRICVYTGSLEVVAQVLLYLDHGTRSLEHSTGPSKPVAQ